MQICDTVMDSNPEPIINMSHKKGQVSISFQTFKLHCDHS